MKSRIQNSEFRIQNEMLTAFLLAPDFWLLTPAFAFASRTQMTGSGQWLYLKAWGALHLSHFFGLRSLRSLRDLKLDFLSLFESFEAVALNGAVVNEDV